MPSSPAATAALAVSDVLVDPALRLAPCPPAARSPHAVTSLSIVLPCFDEAENVAGAVRAAVAAGERCAAEYEVIVVDDGSRDDTAAIVAGLVEANRHVRLVVHVRNRGYGDAVRSGIAAAAMDWVFLTDADLQFDLRELEDFLEHTVRADVVAGWRVRRQDRLHRRINAAAWNWLIRRVFRLRVHDVDCAFKLLRRELVQGFGLTSSGAMISTELLVKAQASGARVDELGVRHLPRVAGSASGARPSVVLRAFCELAALRRAVPRGSRPVTGC
ncbi:MAG TPA: glycosyltransferase family 2 protein [Solirubrobacteraceae bacterium]